MTVNNIVFFQFHPMGTIYAFNPEEGVMISTESDTAKPQNSSWIDENVDRKKKLKVDKVPRNFIEICETLWELNPQRKKRGRIKRT